MIATQFTDRKTNERHGVVLERNLLSPNGRTVTSIDLESRYWKPGLADTDSSFRLLTGMYNSLIKWSIADRDGQVNRERLFDLYQSDTTGIMLESFLEDPEGTLESYDPNSIGAYPDLCYETGLGLELEVQPEGDSKELPYPVQRPAQVLELTRSTLAAICRYAAIVNHPVYGPDGPLHEHFHVANDAELWARFLSAVTDMETALRNRVPCDLRPIVLDRKLGGIGRPLPFSLIARLLEGRAQAGILIGNPNAPLAVALDDPGPFGTWRIEQLLFNYQNHYVDSGTWDVP
jgi:hypothetical protein